MKIGILGSSGAVGQELLQLIHLRQFSADELRLFDSKTPLSFEGLDLLFSCVSSRVAQEALPKAAAAGVVCIDASSAFRNDQDIPLVIPEINAHALQRHQGIIASPNCTTTLMLMALHPLHRLFQIKRVVAATYQAVSGAGAKGVAELEAQSTAHLAGEDLVREVFPKQCAFNVFSHESPKLASGYVEEEEKMQIETCKILEDTSIAVTARCIRVPVFRTHAEALNVEFRRGFDLDEVKEALEATTGLVLKEDVCALDAAGKGEVLCGNIRFDRTQSNTLEMWVVGDQLLKGAALNMIQIAELLCLN